MNDKQKFAGALAFLDVNAEKIAEAGRQWNPFVPLLIKAYKMAVSAPHDWLTVSHFTTTLMIAKRAGLGPGIVEPSPEKIAEHMQLLSDELGVTG